MNIMRVARNRQTGKALPLSERDKPARRLFVHNMGSLREERPTVLRLETWCEHDGGEYKTLVDLDARDLVQIFDKLAGSLLGSDFADEMLEAMNDNLTSLERIKAALLATLMMQGEMEE
jgi:hypothetical protein